MLPPLCVVVVVVASALMPSESDEVVYRTGDTGAGLGCTAGFTSTATIQLQSQLCKKVMAKSCSPM